ncbi:MAG: hypothetical protein LAO24_05695 [Acidobacteriia bacterium]|nr:hypothetical protein [Terriglobia bacterium]
MLEELETRNTQLRAEVNGLMCRIQANDAENAELCARVEELLEEIWATSAMMVSLAFPAAQMN